MSTTQPGAQRRLPREGGPEQSPGGQAGLGEDSGDITQAEGPSYAEAGCEGCEGQMKEGDTRLDRKAGPGQGAVSCASREA